MPQSVDPPILSPRRKKGKTYNTSVILEVQENTISSLPRLRLSNNNSRHDLLSQLRLSLLDSRHNHVTDTTSWQTVETRTDTLDGDDVEISGSAVVAAVHDGTAVCMLVSWAFEVVFRGDGRFRETYTGRPRVILSLPPGAPRLFAHNH